MTGGDELYTISCEVEVVHVIDGRLVVRLGGETLQLHAGDTMTLGGREHKPDTTPPMSRHESPG